jgi:hypothetical protein
MPDIDYFGFNPEMFPDILHATAGSGSEVHAHLTLIGPCGFRQIRLTHDMVGSMTSQDRNLSDFNFHVRSFGS